jgi:hypothetical protein
MEREEHNERGGARDYDVPGQAGNEISEASHVSPLVYRGSLTRPKRIR